MEHLSNAQLRRALSAAQGLAELRTVPLPGPEQLRLLGLTPRQAEVLAHALNGHTSAQIAASLGLSPRTVEKHFEGIYDRLGAANRAQAIATALQALAGERARYGGPFAG